MLAQRKKDSRDASSRSLMRFTVFTAMPGESCSTRKGSSDSPACGHRQFDAGVEPFLLTRLLEQLERPAKVRIGHRAPVRRRISAERMRLADASSSCGREGRDTKSRRRLGVSPAPVGEYGPMMETE
jgi:hypothetical protein